MKDFHKQTAAGARKLQEKKRVGYCSHFPLRVAGVCQVGDLSSTDQVIPD